MKPVLKNTSELQLYFLFDVYVIIKDENIVQYTNMVNNLLKELEINHIFNMEDEESRKFAIDFVVSRCSNFSKEYFDKYMKLVKVDFKNLDGMEQIHIDLIFKEKLNGITIEELEKV